MTLSVAGLAMLGIALLLVAAGAVALLRLRTLGAGTPAAYAARIAGTMLVMLGAILIVFALTYALSAIP